MNLNKTLVFEGLEQIFEREFQQSQLTIKQTVREVIILQNSLESKLIRTVEEVFTECDNFSKIKELLLRRVLSTGQSTAIEIASLVENKLIEEAQRLCKFATAADRVFQYMNASNQPIPATENLEDAPTLQKLQGYRMIYKILPATAESDFEISASSAIDMGTITSLLDIYTVLGFLTNIEIENNFRGIVAVIKEALAQNAAQRSRNLEVFVVTEFEYIKRMIIDNLDELQRSLSKTSITNSFSNFTVQ